MGVATPVCQKCTRLIQAGPSESVMSFIPYVGGEEVNTSPTHDLPPICHRLLGTRD